MMVETTENIGAEAAERGGIRGKILRIAGLFAAVTPPVIAGYAPYHQEQEVHAAAAPKKSDVDKTAGQAEKNIKELKEEDKELKKEISGIDAQIAKNKERIKEIDANVARRKKDREKIDEELRKLVTTKVNWRKEK